MDMSKLLKKLSVIVAGTSFFSITGTTVAEAISIAPRNNGQDLASEILGSGITIMPGSVNYIGATGASGFFQNGIKSGIGIDEGIILSTGLAKNAVGPNNLSKRSTLNGLSGDPDLGALMPGLSTSDATILEFQFKTAGGNVFFNYVFASEEYNQYVGSAFNDVFGFFLNGKNIALIPNTSTPVAISTVNGGNPFGTNGSNPEFFNNNEGEKFNIAFDGFTDVFTAQAFGLDPGVHNIKLAIADGGDSSFDSAVFIQGKTFSDQPTKYVPEPSADPAVFISENTFSAQPTNKLTKHVPEPSAMIGLLVTSLGSFFFKKVYKV